MQVGVQVCVCVCVGWAGGCISKSLLTLYNSSPLLQHLPLQPWALHSIKQYPLTMYNSKHTHICIGGGKMR